MLCVRTAVGLLAVIALLHGCGRPQATPTRVTPSAANDRFIDRFITENNGMGTAVGVFPDGNLVKGWPGLTALFPVANEPDMLVGLCFSDVAPDTERMQVQLLRKVVADSDILIGDYTDPHVIATLDAMQAEHVFQHGLPLGLRDHMVETAITNGWQRALQARHSN